jgi:hypothetical protein
MRERVAISRRCWLFHRLTEAHAGRNPPYGVGGIVVQIGGAAQARTCVVDHTVSSKRSQPANYMKREIVAVVEAGA